MLRLFLAIVLVVSVSACTTGERARELGPGMSKAEVIAKLGNPDGFQQSGDYEALRYTNRLISGWSWDRADYVVVLKNGRVVEYGLGQVRQQSPTTNVLVIVPVR